MSIKEFVSLKSKNSELSKEWDYEKNGELTPETCNCGSHKKVWWKCNNGHEWMDQISNRNRQKSPCPYCSERWACEDNSLFTKFPEIAKEWNYEKNENLTCERNPLPSGRGKSLSKLLCKKLFYF